MGMVRCGKINDVNAGAKSWIGIGGVAGFVVVVRIRQEPHGKQGDMR